MTLEQQEREARTKSLEDSKVTAYAGVSLEASVQLRSDFSGDSNMADFLRIGKRDTEHAIRELLRDGDFVKLARKHNIRVKLLRISPLVTATFELKEE